MAVPMLSLILHLMLLFSASFVSSQQINGTADTDFSCSRNSTATCETYVTYRVQSPNYLDLGSISRLFGISRFAIANANQLVAEDGHLVPNQLLLIPIQCSCNGSYYFSNNVTYNIKAGDSLYSVSIHAFQNLTKYQFAEDMNPSLNPLNLTVGEEVVYPMLCKCPSKSGIINSGNFPYLLTYVWQPGDDLLPVSAMFNTSPQAIAEANNFRNFTSAICLPVLIPVQQPIIRQTLSPPALTRKSKSNKRSLIAGLIAALSLLLLILAVLSYMHGSKKKKKELARRASSVEAALMNSESKSIQDKVIPGVSGYLGKLNVYDTKVIMEATLDLDEQYNIGGSVYRAKIKDQIVAVKKTKDGTEELALLQKVNHGNLMKLVGISFENGRTIFLVFEYAENGSLDKWLFHDSPSCSGSFAYLTWSQRLNIASDVANGLQYLHEHTQPSIVHRDIRSSNILLDSRFKAKISNFALAKPATCSSVLKVDVFAFGVVLLELLSGRKSMETKDSGEIVMPWRDIRGVLEDDEKKEERLRNWMDPLLGSSYPLEGALSLVNLARACTSEKSSERPTMAEIVFSLCLLNDTYSDMHEGSWASGEPEEAIHFATPVKAR
ncbi:OLC1v1009993C1 [Oldenlandia corymbosa var. corymbosa]|uniref:non-specific serine/threonine protein kinase n=1 Tax=Oldenlandia corymbosa var. corymbosa TaxID=529605 RepID=A0AAV1DQ71_OLDCO|nr:OLC1v1009993C1 [Oldenlandia corymbosa var. corymbosa]